MENIQSLRERRNVLAKTARDVLEKHPAGKWDAAAQTAYDTAMNEHDAVVAQIVAFERLLDSEADSKINGQIAEKQAKAARDLPETDPRRIFDTFLRQGEKAISAEQWAAIRNTMSTTTNTEGGYTVQTDIARTMIEALKAYGGMRAVAEVFQTSQGNPLNFPSTDGTAETGELIAENVTATAADPSFGTVSLNTYKFSSKIIAVPLELLQDSAIDMEAFIRRRIGERLGRVTNTYFTTGTGSSQPRGVAVGASSGKVGTTGQTGTVTHDDLVDLVHSVDPAYRTLPGVGFMMNDASVKVIRKLKDTTGRPIWSPAYESGISGGVPGELLGYPVNINQDVATMAANAKSILFGAFSTYKIRDAMDMTMFRFTDSAYIKLGQIAFLAWMRSGGNLTDTAAVKYYQNSAT